MSASSNPVLIGVGQATWRERDARRSPVDALQAVAEAALVDCGSSAARKAVDAVIHVPFLLNQVPDLAAALPRNPGAALAERLGIEAVQYSADVGGNLPQQLLNIAADRLSRGEHRVVMLAGVELLNTFLGGLRAGEGLPEWSTGREDDPQMLVETPPMSLEAELAHGIYEPVAAYPLFESALRHRLGLDAQAHRARLGELVSRMSQVAATHPLAWKQRAWTPEEVLSTEGGNRYICHPYTKLMNAILNVDMAACVLLTTEAAAREMGVPREKMIYLRGAASASDAQYLSERPSLSRSPALERVVQAALAQAGMSVAELDCFDLYSCFPAAVQIGCETLGLALDDPRGVTLTGGLTLFGGPGNNYSLHGIAEMVETLRRRGEGAGLVWANGGYLTKHAVGIYSTEPGEGAWEPVDNGALQAEVDALERPTLAARGEGPMTIEGCTVRYDGETPKLGIALGRLEDGRRCLAQCSDGDSMRRLVERDCVGETVFVEPGEPVNTFIFSSG